MEGLNNLIATILATRPHQLPPVIHSGGTYVLDVKYHGFKLHHVGITLEESLYRYMHFVNGVNRAVAPPAESVSEVPVPPGSKLPTKN